MKNLRNFGIAFAVSAIIIGLAALIITKSLEDTLLSVFDKKDNDLSVILTDDEDNGEDGGSSEEHVNTLKNLTGDSFNVLIVCTDYRPNVYNNYIEASGDASEDTDYSKGIRIINANNICLVQCSKKYGKYVFTPISPITNVHTAAGDEKLGSIYGLYGFEFFKEKIEAMTGVPIDYYAIANCTDMKSIVDVIGAVYCTVPCEIYTDGVDYVSSANATAAKTSSKNNTEYTRFLEACTDSIGPSSMGLLLFKDYSNGIEDEMVITSGYAKGVFKNFAKVSENAQRSEWSQIEQYLTTNITVDFFSQNSSLLTAFTDEIAENVEYPGSFKLTSPVNDSTFEPNISVAVETISKYR